MTILKREFKRFIRKHDPRLSMIAGSSYLPKENVSKPLGEDAHFVVAEANAFGVADGVGGWSKIGVDAGEYSRELMHNVAEAIKTRRRTADPKTVLHEAFLKTEAKGSSTACVLTLGRTLRAANVGDSGFLVVREGKIVFSSAPQQHRFNHPYQLGKTAPCDTPDVAEEITVPVRICDVVIAGTDGLFDNMFPWEVEQVVVQCMLEQSGPEQVALKLSKVAQKNSLDNRRCSPFSTAAGEAGFRHLGGKYDDITVVVAFIVPTIRYL